MIKKIIVSILMLLVLVSSAMAIDVTVGGSSAEVSDSDVTRSNPLAEGRENELDDSRELGFATFTIPVVVSNGTLNITNVVPDTSSFEFETLDNDEVVQADLIDITTSLPVTVTNTTRSVSVKVAIPSNLDSINADFTQIEYSIPITVETTEGNFLVTGTFTVENGLEMSDVDFFVGDDDYRCKVNSQYDLVLDCDDEVEELRPGEDFHIEFEVENVFGDDDELDVRDALIEIDSDDRDVESDDNSFDEDMNSGDTNTITMDFTVDEDVDDNNGISIFIEVSGTDENDAFHGFRYEIPIEFVIPDYDVRVESLTLSPSSICQGETAQIAFDIENYGSRSQDDVQVLIENNDLRVNQFWNGIELEEEDESDNDFRDTYTLRTTPNQEAGRYNIMFTVAYEGEDDDIEYIQLVEQLTIQDCEGDDTPTTDDSDNGSTNTDSGVIEVRPTNPEPQQPVEPSQPTVNSDSNTAAPVTVTARESNNVGLVVGLVFAILVLLVVIGVIVAVLMRKD